MIVRSPKGKYEFIDFRETAPAAAFEDMYKDNEDARYVSSGDKFLILGARNILDLSDVAYVS